MSEFDPAAVLAATVVAFFLSSTYYAVFGERLAEVSDAAARGRATAARGSSASSSFEASPWPRSWLASRPGVTSTTGPAASCLASSSGSASRSCCGLGAIIWENTPRTLAVIHGGDWLAKLLVVAVIVSVWQ